MSYAYVPDWYKKAMSSDEGLVSMNETLKMKPWVTEVMSEEIRKYYPTRDKI